MKKVIVTGAAGFFGFNLAKALLNRGYYVYAVARHGSAHNDRLEGMQNLRPIIADMSQYDSLGKQIKEPCDYFFHLAWRSDERDNFSVQCQSMEAACRALSAAKKIGCRRFICTGSQAEYGPQDGLSAENTLPTPATAYGATKLAACYLTKNQAEQLGLEWIWARIFSLYGPYEPRGRMLPDLAAALLRGESFRLTAATQYWDYLYAFDAAEALIALAEHGQSGEIYNVANGDYRPLKEFTEEVREIIAPSVPIIYGADSRQAISLCPSVAKIQRDTGWRAKTDFADGIRATYGS